MNPYRNYLPITLLLGAASFWYWFSSGTPLTAQRARSTLSPAPQAHEYLGGDSVDSYPIKTKLAPKDKEKHPLTFNYQAFIAQNSPLSPGAGRSAELLFIGDHLLVAASYSKDVINKNKDINEVVDAIPVMLSAYKKMGRQSEFVQGISDSILYLHQLDEAENSSKVDNILFNTLWLITASDTITPQDQRHMLEQLQSHLGQIPRLSSQVADFTARLDSLIRTDPAYSDISRFTYTGGLIIASPL